MAVINTVGVVASETNTISKAGDYLLKITKVELDGYDNESNEKFKLHFEGKAIIDGKYSDDTYTMIDWLEQREKMLWKVARLRDALHSPEVFELEDWVGRYVLATIEMREYNGKKNPNIKKLQYSKANDKLPPIPDRAKNTGEPASGGDEDEENLPF